MVSTLFLIASILYIKVCAIPWNLSQDLPIEKKSGKSESKTPLVEQFSPKID